MATTSVSSTSSTATSSSGVDAALAAVKANRANAQKLITTLGAGSGVDVNALAESLANAEIQPRQNELNGKITRNENKVSGYSAISFSVNALNDAFKSLKDQSGFTGVSVSNSNTSAFNATATGTAQVGSHEVEVVSIAKAQRSLSNGFLSANYPLNAGKTTTATVTLAAGLSIDVPVDAGKDTPTGLVAAINAKTTQTGIKASLVNTGDKGQDPVPSKTDLVGPLLSGGASPAGLGVFSVQVGATAMSVDIRNFSPVPTTLTDLAAALQTQLQAQDTTSINPNITVTVSDTGGLLVTDARGRTISGMSLTKSDNTATGFQPNVVAPGALGVSAKPYKVMLTGPTGAAQGFSIALKDTDTGTALNTMTFGDPLQAASDANIKVDGITYTRSTNSIKDVLTGVTLDLKTPTTQNNPALLDLARDTTPVKDKLTALITAFNDANSVLNVVSDPKSTVEQFGASLVGDSTVRRIREQMRSIVTGESTTPGNGMKQIWQLGISLTQTGQLEIDDTKLEKALQSNFDDVVTMFTGNTENLSTFSTQPSGLAGSAVKKLTDLTSKTGFIQQQSDNATTQIDKYKTDLTKLDTRLQTLLDRYTKQFGVMNNLVGQTNSLKTSLKSSFDGMMAAYTNK